VEFGMECETQPEAPEEALAALSVSIPLADGMESVRSDREPYNWLLTSFA